VTLVAFLLLINFNVQDAGEQLGYSQLMTEIQNEQVKKVVMGGSVISGERFDGSRFETIRPDVDDPKLLDTMLKHVIVEGRPPELGMAATQMAVGFIPFMLVLILLTVYFVPTIVAAIRGHQSARAVFALNLLVGWTFLGWVVAFVWALTNLTQVAVDSRTSESAADEILKLGSLRDQGLLTDEEFNMKKRQLLDHP